MGYCCLSFALLALALSGNAEADIFKCRTRDGRAVISSEPCQEGSKTEAVRPSEKINPEQQREAEQHAARERERLVEKEKAQASEQLKEQESRRRLAEEESARQTRCLDNAQREPDPALRANLIAACQGATPAPAVAQQPVVYPGGAPTSVIADVTLHYTGLPRNPAVAAHQPATYGSRPGEIRPSRPGYDATPAQLPDCWRRCPLRMSYTDIPKGCTAS